MEENKIKYKICSECGASMDFVDNYCSFCGNSLENSKITYQPFNEDGFCMAFNYECDSKKSCVYCETMVNYVRCNNDI